MVAAYQGQLARGATLLGAAKALRTSEKSVRLPTEELEFNEALAHLTAEIGGRERDALMAKGAKMGVDEAVDFALEKTSSLNELEDS